MVPDDELAIIEKNMTGVLVSVLQLEFVVGLVSSCYDLEIWVF